VTYVEWLRNATQRLEAVSTTARLDALVLLEHVTKKNRAYLLAEPEHIIDATAEAQLSVLEKARIAGTPLAYLIGTKEFYGHSFLVNPHVLIPRPETEDMVVVALELLKENPECSILEIGTGCGCIAISLALANQQRDSKTKITASDTSKMALRVAAKNAELNEVANLSLVHGSLLTPFKTQNLAQTIVIANLPYVPKEERFLKKLASEPYAALFTDENGLKLYRLLFAQAAQKEVEHIVTESLIEQHDAMAVLAQKCSFTLKKSQGLIQHFAHIR
jgi:release factor glutamine methyltransferase